MDTATVSSTFLLTALMLVGLVFFIRASTKDRTESIRLASSQSVESLHQSLRDYFDTRSYTVKAFGGEAGIVTWEGFVQASLGLAIFLSFLAAIGLVCLALVLTILFPQANPLGLGLVLLSPVAGGFYWKKASRLEEVSYRIRPDKSSGSSSSKDQSSDGAEPGGSVLSIAAHRDEIISLQQSIAFQEVEA